MQKVVHCRTQEQWDFVVKTLRYDFTISTFKSHPCINIEERNSSQSLQYYLDRKHDREIISFEEFLKLKNISMMKYKQGDILISGSGDKVKILGICGEVYLRSSRNNLNTCQAGFTEKELDGAGFKLFQEPQVKELTIDEIAAKFGVKPEEIKIKK